MHPITEMVYVSLFSSYDNFLLGYSLVKFGNVVMKTLKHHHTGSKNVYTG